MPNKTASYDAERVHELAEQIMRHKRLYYAGKPEISDHKYDEMEAELARMAPRHPALMQVGTDTEITGKKIEHEHAMLSLQKTYERADLHSWRGDHDVLGTLKVDGNSLSLIYRDGVLHVAKTRGNGRVGEDVTEKAAWVSDIVPRLTTASNLEIRGELYCTTSNFVLLTEEMVSRKLEKPTNPRNIVAGQLGRKTHIDLARYFNFFAFEVHTNENALSFATEVARCDWLEKQGFRLPSPLLLKSAIEVDAYLEKVKKVIEADEIGLDGAVFSYNDLALHRELGNTAHHPRYKMSFKWQGETAEATVADVTWSTSRLGIVTPVAVINPVVLSGAKITNITLHNAAHVKEFNLKKGDRIEIVRSGEVIPKFLQVLEESRGRYRWPEKCPSCSHPLEYDDVRLKCPNASGCPAQEIGRILNWIRCAEIDDLSEKRLIPLMDAGLVRSAGDLYRLKKDDFLVIPLTKEKMATKLFNNVQGARQLDLSRFLNGLGIEGAGLTTWERILAEHATLEEVLKLTPEQLVEIDGFAEKSAQQIVTGLCERKNQIDDLLAAGVDPQEKKGEASSDALHGLSFVITGALSRPRTEIEAMIKGAGGKVASSVSKNTHAVITNDPDSGSSKMKKARSLKVPIWSEEQLQGQLT